MNTAGAPAQPKAARGDMLSLPHAGQYGCILADPPWRFRTWNETNQHKSASRHYALMDLDAMKALPVADLAAKDCALLLWACNPMVPHALDVMAAWGFTFKTVALTWAKRSSADKSWHFGMGYWTRQNTEQVFLGVRGKPKATSRGVPQLLVSPRREHSRKPDEQYERIERLVAGPYVELFARQTRPRWDSWGLEVGKFDAAHPAAAVGPSAGRVAEQNHPEPQSPRAGEEA